MVTILPWFDEVGMDFLNTDCMLENPLLSDVEKCPCFRIKYPEEFVLNTSVLPQYLTESEVLGVYVLRNISQFDYFSIMSFVEFPSLNGGFYPLSCHQVSGVSRGIYRYDDFFEKRK